MNRITISAGDFYSNIINPVDGLRHNQVVGEEPQSFTAETLAEYKAGALKTLNRPSDPHASEPIHLDLAIRGYIEALTVDTDPGAIRTELFGYAEGSQQGPDT